MTTSRRPERSPQKVRAKLLFAHILCNMADKNVELKKSPSAKANTPSVIDEFDREQSEREGFEQSGGWQRMGMDSASARATAVVDHLVDNARAIVDDEDFWRVLWLSGTLFFIVGGYWLLRSLKDPIISAIDGVECIPMAKIVSLVAVFGLVIIYNKLLDIMPKHHIFYGMGIFYGVIFGIMGLMLYHPTIGLSNTEADPSRWLGWVSYVTIETFGSMVTQCYWALVNASVDARFAKKNFGFIIAGAQIGSILGPSLATKAETIGIPILYLLGSLVMFFMAAAMYYYVQRYGVAESGAVETANATKENPSMVVGKKEEENKKEKGGILEGFYLLYKHDFVKGIFFISSLFMVNITVIDYMMKVLALERYNAMYPNDQEAAGRAFASFMGYFGQTTNGISFAFSLLGTGAVIKKWGLSTTLLAFPVLLGACSTLVWMSPTLWVVFTVMMIIKGMSYALNNPTKEILYQATSSAIKFKCKSWIDTFGQRSAKALGSLITNACASDIVDLNNYGYLVGAFMSGALVFISKNMGEMFEKLQEEGIKVGEEVEDDDVSQEQGNYSAIEESNEVDIKKEGGNKLVV